jgi:hypothetical protein
MKLFIFFLLSFSIALNLNAQVFAPNDAVWHYSYDPDITLDDGFQRIEVIGDTLIDQHSCKILSTSNVGYNWVNKEYYEIPGDEIILYEKDSVVFYLKSNEFYILYDFSAKQGDSFTSICYPKHCDSTFLITIDTISYLTHNQDSLRKFHLSINNERTSYYYVDKIGYSEYILPMFDVGCDVLTGPHYPGPLRCYQDSIIGQYITGVSSACDYITDVQETSTSNRFSLYPNPAHESLQLSIGDDQVYTYEVRDSYGRLLERKSFQSEISVDVSDYVSGLYFVTLRSKLTLLGTRKILKY